jgi:putative two-component system response regulator
MDAIVRAPAEPATIMLVEDDPDTRHMLSELVTALGHGVVTAESGEKAVALLDAISPDLVITDVHMGAMSGIDLCARIKSDPRYELTPVVMLTAIADVDARVAGLAAGADDFFAKPVDFNELGARLRALLRVKALLGQLERAEGVITTLALTIEARDPYTAGHCDRLAHYGVAVGEALKVDAAMIKALRLGGYLHDLGKISVPDSILLKPGPLDAAELASIRLHPGAGADLVLGLKSLEEVRPIIRHHHERWNGTGYPDGLAGKGIPLGARIIAVVDVYDALHTQRPYRPALSSGEAVSILERETEAGYWDPRVVAAFLEVLPGLESDSLG